MENLEKYNLVFKSQLSLDDESLNNALMYQSVEAWDSIGHMGLISALENEFAVSLDIDDVIDFSSYEKGKEILKKYGVEIER
jgi:acyl carrier protein